MNLSKNRHPNFQDLVLYFRMLAGYIGSLPSVNRFTAVIHIRIVFAGNNSYLFQYKRGLTKKLPY